LRFDSPSPEATHAAAAALAAGLGADGLVVALVGPLGAGKTLFAKGLAEGLGIDPRRVVSPTFVIASEYVGPGGRRLAHVDLYRVGDRAELEATGFADLLEPGGVLLVEWADRFPEALPRDRLEVRIERPAGGSASQRRVLHAMALGNAAAAALAQWSAALGRDVEADANPAG
jgi:tRNA threonylcarbamoyladenosine biosynthesis protein TsaE